MAIDEKHACLTAGDRVRDKKNFTSPTSPLMPLQKDRVHSKLRDMALRDLPRKDYHVSRPMTIHRVMFQSF